MSATTNSVPSGMHAAFQNLYLQILERLGLTGVTIPDKFSRMTLQTTPDGQGVNCSVMSLGGAASDTVATINSLTALPVETPRTNNPIFGSALPGTTGVSGVLAAGTVTVTLANKTNDLLCARVTTAGGTPSAYLGCKSASATTVTVFGQTSGGALNAADTSTVEVFNMGNPAA